jgi:hypothetical protein
MEKYYRNLKIVDGELDDNQVMMHLEKGKYFGLNKVGKRIWQLVEQPKSLDEIIVALLSEYNVSEEQCRQEVKFFLKNAVDNEIILKNDLVQ